MYLSEDVKLYIKICAFHCTSIKIEKVILKKDNGSTQTGDEKTVEVHSVGTLREGRSPFSNLWPHGRVC